MAIRPKPKNAEIATVVGRVVGFDAPNKAPGGPDGPTYIVFALVGETEGRIFNAVFYIEIDTTDGLAPDYAANMAAAFARGDLVEVAFPADKWPDHNKDPSAIVKSVVPAVSPQNTR